MIKNHARQPWITSGDDEVRWRYGTLYAGRYNTACAILGLTWLVTFSSGSVWAESNVPSGNAPAAPAHEQPTAPAHEQPTAPAHEQHAKPPAAAPRQPVHRAGSAHLTPVVPPSGPTKPHKPPPVTPPAPAAAPSAEEPKAVSPEKPPDSEQAEGAPARLPRFASLRSDDVNMRAGPGTRYRIDWVYKRRELPVEIEREYDVWRWVRDSEGIQGWVHQATLMGRRSFIVQKGDVTLRADSSDTASAVAILKPGVIGHIRSCEASSDWCNVQAGNYRGYLRRQQFWGLLPGEAVNP
jgi:SH3-like domain-containing protein